MSRDEHFARQAYNYIGTALDHLDEGSVYVELSFPELLPEIKQMVKRLRSMRKTISKAMKGKVP